MRQRRARYLVAPLVITPTAAVAAVALAVRFRLTQPLTYVRRFNKRVFNRLVVKWAGRHGSPLVLIQHTGRRTGRRFATPVVAVRTDDALCIALTYGPRTDWCRNVRAAGHATILRDGRVYTVREPELVGASLALPAFSLPLRLGCRLLGINEFLQVTIDRQAAAQ